MTGQVRIKLNDILKARGLSKQDFADRSGMNYRTVLDLTREKYDRIGLNTIAVICDALNVLPGDLFEYRAVEQKSPSLAQE